MYSREWVIFSACRLNGTLHTQNIYTTILKINNVRIVAQHANPYIVAFCIAISYNIYLSGDGGQAMQMVGSGMLSQDITGLLIT